MSGLTPPMYPPRRVERGHGVERLGHQVLDAAPRKRRLLGHRLAQARAVDQVGDDEHAAIVLAEVADVQEARVRRSAACAPRAGTARGRRPSAAGPRASARGSRPARQARDACPDRPGCRAGRGRAARRARSATATRYRPSRPAAGWRPPPARTPPQTPRSTASARPAPSPAPSSPHRRGWAAAAAALGGLDRPVRQRPGAAASPDRRHRTAGTPVSIS